MVFDPQAQEQAEQQIAGRRSGAGSMIYAGPKRSVDYFFNPYVLTAAAGIGARTGAAYAYPFLSPVAIPGVRQKVINAVRGTMSPKMAASEAPEAITALLGGGYSFGASRLAPILGDDYGRPVWKAVHHAVRYAKRKGYTGPQAMAHMTAEIQRSLLSAEKAGRLAQGAPARIFEKLGIGTGKKLAEMSPTFGKVLRGSLAISHISSAVLPALAITAAGFGISRGMELAYKFGTDLVESAKLMGEQMRGLEFGSGLGPGYMSQAGATERQRAINVLSRTHLAGRRGLGTEAQNYAALI